MPPKKSAKVEDSEALALARPKRSTRVTVNYVDSPLLQKTFGKRNQKKLTKDSSEQQGEKEKEDKLGNLKKKTSENNVTKTVTKNVQPEQASDKKVQSKKEEAVLPEKPVRRLKKADSDAGSVENLEKASSIPTTDSEKNNAKRGGRKRKEEPSSTPQAEELEKENAKAEVAPKKPRLKNEKVPEKDDKKGETVAKKGEMVAKKGETVAKKGRGKNIKEVKPQIEEKPAVVHYSLEDLECTKLSKNGKPWNLKICSWNVDGFRAWVNKKGHEFLGSEKPDIFCIQEVRCPTNKLPTDIVLLPNYYNYWDCGEKDGYAGVGLLSKQMPLNVVNGLGNEELDADGRIITAEYSTFYVVCTYVPNAGRGLVTLPKRLKWNEALQEYLATLDKKKPVILCGDMNVAHNEIDLANPKTNKKNAGFTPEERQGMTNLLDGGFVDSFRNLYPDKTQAYTFWTYMKNCRAKNVGWRLDYFIISERLMDNVCEQVLRTQVTGSDHCPITLFMHMRGLPDREIQRDPSC